MRMMMRIIIMMFIKKNKLVALDLGHHKIEE